MIFIPSGALSMSSMLSATSSDRRNAPAKPINSKARSRRPFRSVPVFAAIASNRSAVAGAFLILAVPKVRRMPLTVALTNSSSVGVAKPANLWAYLIAAVRRPIVEALTLRLASCARKAATVAGHADAPPFFDLGNGTGGEFHETCHCQCRLGARSCCAFHNWHCSQRTATDGSTQSVADPRLAYSGLSG